jgi:outer membrane protein TolC
MLSFSEDWGHSNAFGAQDFGPTVRSSIYPYQAQFTFSWDVFDGGARRNEVARAESSQKEAQSQLTNLSCPQCECNKTEVAGALSYFEAA